MAQQDQIQVWGDAKLRRIKEKIPTRGSPLGRLA